ncbi:uncharacterized protein [Setaria viridis]|uniref:uncharacterized protein n=1 Tax=Setaria viridis TaxID=4556 RepID=UPI0014935B76|nr:uncharacterized protein LOC117834349 [Setaria viridis]
MDVYCLEVRKLENKCSGLEFHHMAHDNNVPVDMLSKLRSTRAQVPAWVFVHELHKPSIQEPAPSISTDRSNDAPNREVIMIDVDWRTPFIDYIKEHKLPPSKTEAEKVSRRGKNYVLIGDKLYRRGVSSGVLMKYVSHEDGKDILEEIHNGIYTNHASSRMIVGKAFRVGFYWPKTLKDAKGLVRCLCRVMKDLPEPSGNKDKGKAKEDEDDGDNGKFQNPSNSINVIFGGTPGTATKQS